MNRNIVRYAWLLVAILLLAAQGAAQPIHGDPQKSAYASPAEWPYISTQCHARPANFATNEHADAFGVFNPSLGHVHVDWSLPIYAEIDSAIQVPFTIKLFHVAGYVEIVWADPVQHIIWTETGTDAMPSFVGDPNGLVIKTGYLVLDPFYLGGQWPPPPQGWFFTRIAARVQFDTGVRMDANMLASLYSVKDPDAEQTPPLTSTDPNLQANCQMTGPTDTNSPFGSAVSEYRQYIPLSPISVVYPIDPIEYNYGGTIAAGTFQQRLDPDIHNGITGTLLATADADNGARFLGPLPTGIDPAVLGVGKHHVSTIWQQQSGPVGSQYVAPNEEVWALLVIPVEVTGTPQPVITCEDPKADNLGKLLPCTYLLPPARLPASADGTTIPPAGSIVDDRGTVWTIGPDQEIQRDGHSSNGGFGSTVVWSGGFVFTFGLNGIWYRWIPDAGWLPGAPQD